MSSSPIIDASKLSLYGSTVTAVADFAQSSSVTTFMASMLSQVTTKCAIVKVGLIAFHIPRFQYRMNPKISQETEEAPIIKIKKIMMDYSKLENFYNFQK